MLGCYLLETYLFLSSERQTGSKPRAEGRWQRASGSRWMGNESKHIAWEKNIF